MENIFKSVGKIIKEFQELEASLAFLVYFNCLPRGAGIDVEKEKEKALLELAAISDATLGHKLKRVKELQVFEKENDIIVLDFLKDKRNYVVHHFFADNTFSSPAEIEQHGQELQDIHRWSELINTALKRMVSAWVKHFKGKI